MFSLQSAGLIDGRKFSASNSAPGQPQSASSAIPEQSTQSQGPSPPFGPSPFSNPSPAAALQNFQHQIAAANSASSSQSPMNGIANFPNGPFPFLPLIQMAAAARSLVANSPQQKPPDPSPSSSAASFSNSTNSSSSPAQQLFNGVFHQPAAHFPPQFPPSIQQLQQLNLFLQMQQHNQQQAARQQQNAQPPQLGHDPALANWLQLFAALSSSNAGAINGPQHLEGGNLQPISADKKLERDSEGNALCPACHEPIGKESGQWAKHLELERAKLQNTIQRLKRKAQEENCDGKNEMEGNLNATEEKRKRNAVLERIRQNQRKRLDAKLRGTFYLGSESLAKLIDGTNLPMPTPIQGNGEEKGSSQNFKNSNEIGNNGKLDGQQPIGGRGDWKKEQICAECKSESSVFLVFNVQSKMFQCLECFQQIHRQQNGVGEKVDLHPNNLNGFGANGFAHQQQKTMASRKRLSPPFSALELASGVVENDQNSEQKRPKLELTTAE